MFHNNAVGSLRAFQYFFHATNAIMISFLPVYFKSKGLSGSEIGFLLAVGPFASLFSQSFWGFVSDKYKTIKWILFICLIGFLMSGLFFFQLDAFASLMLMGAILFFFMSPLGALGDGLSQRTANDLNISFGGIRTWGSIGFASTALLIGGVFSVIGISNILFPFLFYTVIALLVCLTLSDVHVSSKPLQFKDIQKLTGNGSFLLFLFLILFITITHRTNDSFIGIYVKDLGGSDSLIGWAWFAGVASEALVFALGSLWLRYFHELTFIVIAGLLYSLRWFLYSFVSEPLPLVFFQVMHGMTFAVFYLAALQYVAKIVPRELQATGLLMFVSVFFGLSGVIGALLGGTVIEQVGGATLYRDLGCLALLGSLGVGLYHHVGRKKVAKMKNAVSRGSD